MSFRNQNRDWTDFMSYLPEYSDNEEVKNIYQQYPSRYEDRVPDEDNMGFGNFADYFGSANLGSFDDPTDFGKYLQGVDYSDYNPFGDNEPMEDQTGLKDASTIFKSNDLFGFDESGSGYNDSDSFNFFAEAQREVSEPTLEARYIAEKQKEVLRAKLAGMQSGEAPSNAKEGYKPFDSSRPYSYVNPNAPARQQNNYGSAY